MNHLNGQIVSLPLAVGFVLLVTALCCYSREKSGHQESTIEVFTTADYPIYRKRQALANLNHSATYTVYVVDRIDQLQTALSHDLPANPEQAKQVALTRFQSMDGDLSQQLENAAQGLAKALFYRVDRYPAIVFDGKAVVYGVTELDDAVDRYTRWRDGASQ